MSKNYLCILFCVSSGQNGENLGCDEQEIINICYQLIDTKSLKTISVNNYLIQPANKTDFNLSNECKSLTGLSEIDLQDSFFLYQVIDLFDKNLKEFGIENCHFITDGCLHLRQSIIPECTKKDIKLPDYYYSYYDIRKEFQKYTGLNQKINSLDDINNFLMTERKNDENSYAIKQCKLIENILVQMLQNSHNLEECDYISKELEQGICSFDDNIQMNTIARVRGLPWHVNDHDVQRFFSGLNICEGGVALCLSVQGRRNGEALVRFVNEDQRNLALRRHKHHIGQRYIEVYRASGKEFMNIIGGTNNEAKLFLSRNGKIIIRMRGLPFEANAKDVKDFFESGDNSCQIVDGESGVLFVHYPDGRATGDAFVMFKDEEETSRALLKHKAMMGARYIELFRSTSAEVQQVLKRCQDPKYYQNNFKEIQAAPLPILPPEMITGNRKDCIRLRNLPIECGVEQILEFLGIHSQHIVHQGCHMIFNAQGQPSGEAFIQFDSELSSFNASTHKNGKCMYFGGKKYFIEVIQCSGEEMNLVLLGLLPSNLINVQQIPTPTNQSINTNLNSSSYLLYNQIPPSTNQNNINPPIFFHQPNQQTRQLNNPQLQTSQFYQPNTLVSNSTLNNQLITTNQYSNYPPQIFYYLTPPVSPTSAVFLQQNIPNFHHPSYSQQPQLQQFNNKFILPTIEYVKLILKGLPINVSPFEIMEFLKDCGEILPELIQIQNSDGFSNMLDVIITCERSVAERVLIEKNRQKIGNNIVEIYLAI